MRKLTKDQLAQDLEFESWEALMAVSQEVWRQDTLRYFVTQIRPYAYMAWAVDIVEDDHLEVPGCVAIGPTVAEAARGIKMFCPSCGTPLTLYDLINGAYDPKHHDAHCEWGGKVAYVAEPIQQPPEAQNHREASQETA